MFSWKYFFKNMSAVGGKFQIEKIEYNTHIYNNLTKIRNI